ncbi:MAG TPA: hypothetical protein VFD42_06440, partial [Chloroflexota bacterium]|nr:hypothetical protein [Chloroflexota bacterium]
SLAVWGEDAEVEQLFRLALELKGANTSGDAESLEECSETSSRCKGHRSCVYRSPQLVPGAR